MFKRKITTGYVVQVFECYDNGGTPLPISQEFVAVDQVEWEDMYGNPIDPDEKCPYVRFEMRDPDDLKE